jgi:hypothetical protein
MVLVCQVLQGLTGPAGVPDTPSTATLNCSCYNADALLVPCGEWLQRMPQRLPGLPQAATAD